MDIPILKDITVIFIVATVSLLICSRLKVPGILGYLVTGLVVGPNGLRLVADVHNVNTMADIGVVLLLFTIGLEFSLRQLVALKRSAIGGGAAQVAFTSAIIACACLIMGMQWNKAVFYGLILTLSSTAIVLKILSERGELEAPYGRITTSILIFQDIAVIPVMLIIPMLAPGGNASISEIAWTLGRALVVVVALFAAARFIVPRILMQVTKTKSRELFLFSVVLICIVVAFITNKAGLSLALGAFLAGMVVSETGYGYQALGNVVPFKDVFTGFFFVSVGMMINMEIFFSSPLIIAAAALFVILVKTAVASMVINLLGYPIYTSVRTGLSLAQVGEFSFILAATGKAAGIFSTEEQSAFIAISVLTMAAAPFLIQFSNRISSVFVKLPLPSSMIKGYFHQEESEEKRPSKDHIIIVGYGIAGRNIAQAAKKAGIEYVVIEMNPRTVRAEKEKGTPIFYGDAAQDEVLRHASIENARSVVVSSGDNATAKNIVEAVHRINPAIAVVVRTRFILNAASLRELGATDIVVEEVESSVALLASVLKHYYVPAEEIEKFEADIRQADASLLRRRIRQKSSAPGLKGIKAETVTVPVESTLAGKNLRDLDVRYRYNVNVIAIRSGDTLKIAPGASDIIRERDELLITGRKNDMELFAVAVASSKANISLNAE